MSIADLAQLAEHVTSNDEVGGSNPLVGTFICGSSSVVEHHLAMVGVAGSNPVFRLYAPIAQLDRVSDYESEG